MNMEWTVQAITVLLSELGCSLGSQEFSQGVEFFTWRWGRAERRKGDWHSLPRSGTTDPMAVLRMGPDSMLSALSPAREQPYHWAHTWLTRTLRNPTSQGNLSLDKKGEGWGKGIASLFKKLKVTVYLERRG